MVASPSAFSRSTSASSEIQIIATIAKPTQNASHTTKKISSANFISGYLVSSLVSHGVCDRFYRRL